uniref:Coluporin-21 n=1 Tax=Colubraria reticulata TaxID=604273 RepID=A0A499RUH1_9CAEN|nr:coluporin-21 [Colubraria reticulata]
MVLQLPRLKTVLVIFLFVIGHEPAQATGQDRDVDHKIVELNIRKTITDGKSLEISTLKSKAENLYSMTAVIQVENWTRFPLLSGEVHLYSGTTTSQPPNILPGETGCLALRKKLAVVYGTSGTVSWEVQGANRFLVVMWTVPYDRSTYSNWMAVGMTKKWNTTTVPQRTSFYDQMYHRSSDERITFSRKEFHHHAGPVSFRNDEEFQIIGEMTSFAQAVVTVTFQPDRNNYRYWYSEIRSNVGEPNSQ